MYVTVGDELLLLLLPLDAKLQHCTYFTLVLASYCCGTVEWPCAACRSQHCWASHGGAQKMLYQFLYRFCSYVDIAASSVLVVLITLNFINCQITDILIFTNFSDQFIKVINFRVL
jgi:hypothetical protein